MSALTQDIGCNIMQLWRSKVFGGLTMAEQAEMKKIAEVSSVYEDEPDGAYFALMAEAGITDNDLIWYSEIVDEIRREFNIILEEEETYADD